MLIRDDVCASGYVRENRWFHIHLAAIWNGVRPNLAATLKHSENDCFAVASGIIHAFYPLGLMHVLHLATDERLINLHWPVVAQLCLTRIRHGSTNPVQHEPRRL